MRRDQACAYWEVLGSMDSAVAPRGRISPMIGKDPITVDVPREFHRRNCPRSSMRSKRECGKPACTISLVTPRITRSASNGAHRPWS